MWTTSLWLSRSCGSVVSEHWPFSSWVLFFLRSDYYSLTFSPPVSYFAGMVYFSNFLRKDRKETFSQCICLKLIFYSLGGWPDEYRVLSSRILPFTSLKASLCHLALCITVGKPAKMQSAFLPFVCGVLKLCLQCGSWFWTQWPFRIWPVMASSGKWCYFINEFLALTFWVLLFKEKKISMLKYGTWDISCACPLLVFLPAWCSAF